jgi:integrase
MAELRNASASSRSNWHRLYTDLAKSGLADGAVRQVHAILHRSLRQAELWGFVARSVADGVTPPRARSPEMQTLSPGQVRDLLDSARGDRYEALFVLAVTTGMRQAELLGLCTRSSPRKDQVSAGEAPTHTSS